jgi:hypothetical protein
LVRAGGRSVRPRGRVKLGFEPSTGCSIFEVETVNGL